MTKTYFWYPRDPLPIRKMIDTAVIDSVEFDIFGRFGNLFHLNIDNKNIIDQRLAKEFNR